MFAALGSSRSLVVGLRGESDSYPCWKAERDLYIEILRKEKDLLWLSAAARHRWVTRDGDAWRATEVWDADVCNPVTTKLKM